VREIVSSEVTIVIASDSEAIQSDCFVAEPVIGRAFARPAGSSQ